MNIESKLWKVVSLNDSYVTVIQKASGESRMVKAGKFPDTHELAMAHELRFNRICREAFHNETELR